MNRFRIWCRRLFVLVTVLPSAAQTVASSSAATERTAQLINVSSEVSQLEKLSKDGAAPDRWQVLWLHEHILEEVTAASLQVDATMAQIDNEIAHANEVRGYLSDRRDHAVNRANLLSALLGGSIGATSSGLQLSSGLSRPAAGVGIGAGSLSAGLALAGIHDQKGKTSPFAFESNMLAEFFDRPTLPNSRYLPTIWTFLSEPSPTGETALTRKEQLLQTWLEVKRIDSLDSADKINRLTSEPSAGVKLTIDDFDDRVAMLQDVRARISYLKRDLGALLVSLPASRKSSTIE